MSHPSTRCHCSPRPRLPCRAGRCRRAIAAATAARRRPRGPPPAGGHAAHARSRSRSSSASEFIATLRSLRSTTVQPEVEGIGHAHLREVGRSRARRHAARPDRSRQAAGGRAQHGSQARGARGGRPGTGASRSTRLEALVTAGADQPAGARAGAERAQDRRGQARRARGAGARRAVQLQYYRVAAPQAGVVGDIPVRVRRSRHARRRVITTIDQNERARGLHPGAARRAPELRLGLPVQLLDADGKVGRGQPDHVHRAARRRGDAVGARQERC